jgi:hypothetical protein
MILQQLSILIVILMALPLVGEAACPSRSYSYTAGNVIDPSQNTTNEDNVYNYLCTGVDTYKSGSVDTTAIANGTITNSDIASNTITAAELAADSVTASEIATSAVTTTEILDGTIVGDDLADNTLDAEEIDETDGYAWSGSDTHTGTLDVSGGTFIVKTATDCSGVTAEGSECWDSDDEVKYIGTGSAAQAVGNPGTPALTLGTSNSAGTATSVIRTDATIAAFDATVPATQAFSDSAATGSATVAARRDHVHGMPVTPIVTAVAGAFGSPAGNNTNENDGTTINVPEASGILTFMISCHGDTSGGTVTVRVRNPSLTALTMVGHAVDPLSTTGSGGINATSYVSSTLNVNTKHFNAWVYVQPAVTGNHKITAQWSATGSNTACSTSGFWIQ